MKGGTGSAERERDHAEMTRRLIDLANTHEPRAIGAVVEAVVAPIELFLSAGSRWTIRRCSARESLAAQALARTVVRWAAAWRGYSARQRAGRVRRLDSELRREAVAVPVYYGIGDDGRRGAVRFITYTDELYHLRSAYHAVAFASAHLLERVSRKRGAVRVGKCRTCPTFVWDESRRGRRTWFCDPCAESRRVRQRREGRGRQPKNR